MTDPKYQPESTEAALGRLVEECGEVLAAVGKAQRFGLDSVNPEQAEADLAGENVALETNREWILRELKDLQEAVSGARYFLV